MVLGPRNSAKQMRFGIPAGPTGDDPGIIVFESSSSAAAHTNVFLWADSSNQLRYSSTLPTDEDANGSVIGAATGSYASQTLDNLNATACNTTLKSDTTLTDDLGSSSAYWLRTYSEYLYFNSTALLDGSVAGAVTVTGNVYFGATGSSGGYDVGFYGATSGYDVLYDTSVNTLAFLDNAILGIGTGAAGACDVTLAWDATDCHLDFKAANSVFNFGSAHPSDLVLHGNDAGQDVYWDGSADSLVILDGANLKMGTGASGTAGDINIAYITATDILAITQVASGTGVITIGADDKGIDTKFFGEAASTYMLYDQNGSTDGALVFVDNAIIFDQTNVDYLLDAASDGLLLSATDHGSAKFTIGSAVTTNGLDLCWQSHASGSTVTFDAAAHSCVFDDVTIGFTYGSTSVGTIAYAATHIYWDAGTTNDVLNFGHTTTMDVQFDGAATDALWDASASSFVFNDSSILAFGTASADGTIASDGTNIDFTITALLTMGDGGTTNYLSVSAGGVLTTVGTANIVCAKAASTGVGLKIPWRATAPTGAGGHSTGYMCIKGNTLYIYQGGWRTVATS